MDADWPDHSLHGVVKITSHKILVNQAEHAWLRRHYSNREHRNMCIIQSYIGSNPTHLYRHLASLDAEVGRAETYG